MSNDVILILSVRFSYVDQHTKKMYVQLNLYFKFSSRQPPTK